MNRSGMKKKLHSIQNGDLELEYQCCEWSFKLFDTALRLTYEMKQISLSSCQRQEEDTSSISLVCPSNPCDYSTWVLTHCEYIKFSIWSGCLMRRMQIWGLLWTTWIGFSKTPASFSGLSCSAAHLPMLDLFSHHQTAALVFPTIYTQDGGVGMKAPMSPAQLWITRHV